jgi:hypothetical protein
MSVGSFSVNGLQTLPPDNLMGCLNELEHNMLDLMSESMHYSIQPRLANTLGASRSLIKYCIKSPNIRLDAILYQVTLMLPGAKPGKHFPTLFPQRSFWMTVSLGQIQLNLATIGKL